MKKTHELIQISYHKKPGFPKKLHFENFGYFSSNLKIEKHIRSKTQEKDDNNSMNIIILCYQVFTYNNFFHKYPIEEKIFLPCGKLHGSGSPKFSNETSPFKGRDKKLCKFQKGETVSFISGDNLEIGIISKIPPSPGQVKKINKRMQDRLGKDVALDQGDDSYLILCGKDDSDHDHVKEFHMFKLAEEKVPGLL